jgi:hypothetical protein
VEFPHVGRVLFPLHRSALRPSPMRDAPHGRPGSFQIGRWHGRLGAPKGTSAAVAMHAGKTSRLEKPGSPSCVSKSSRTLFSPFDFRCRWLRWPRQSRIMRWRPERLADADLANAEGPKSGRPGDDWAGDATQSHFQFRRR